MGTGLDEEQVRVALATAADTAIPVLERVEMLMQIAMSMQQQPKHSEQIRHAVRLYEEAMVLCPRDEVLFRSRLTARRGTALLAIPDLGHEHLDAARTAFEESLETLSTLGSPEEVAEVNMNLGLVLQTLVGHHRARIQDAISAYQNALRTFDKHAFPKEFAILNNNLATAFLSIPFTDVRSKMREALAVQCFEEALAVVNLTDHPNEYAMLQNNLGNALQYSSTSHALENNERALHAYAEALRVRNARDTPIEYANTLANRSNCLRNLPDANASEESTGDSNLASALAGYREAAALFDQHGDGEKAESVRSAIAEIESELDTPLPYEHPKLLQPLDPRARPA